jgi:hypothetical protein
MDSRKSVFELPNLSMPIRCNPKEKLPMDVVGDVSGRIAIIVVSCDFFLFQKKRCVLNLSNKNIYSLTLQQKKMLSY